MIRWQIAAVVLGCWVNLQAAETWTRHVIDASSQGADGVRLADFNRDGRLDIVTGWEEGGVVRLYLQPANALLREPWPAVTVGRVASVEDAVAVDLDLDGFLDVVSSCEGADRTLYVHWAPKTDGQVLNPQAWITQALPASVGRQSWMFCLPLQVDDRHGVDLVVGSKGSRGAVGWWQAPEDPRDVAAWKYHRWTAAGWVMSLIPRDVDQDGDLDVIYSDRKGPRRGVKWLERPNEGGGTWEVHDIGGTDREVLFLHVGDLDQDGQEDILAATWNHKLDLYRRLAGRAPRYERHSVNVPFQVPHAKSLVAADLDRDGRLDLSVTVRSQPPAGPAVAWMRYRDDPWSGPWRIDDVGGPRGSKFDLIEALDLDADGDLDLITCEEVSNLGVIWYENPTF